MLVFELGFHLQQALCLGLFLDFANSFFLLLLLPERFTPHLHRFSLSAFVVGLHFRHLLSLLIEGNLQLTLCLFMLLLKSSEPSSLCFPFAASEHVAELFLFGNRRLVQGLGC
ncbi:uncharacterized protein PV09_01462, partial [Verruconis gallopava]